jgi:CBS domain-containing protein
MSTNAERFLDAFARIERHLRRRLEADRSSVGFSALVSRAVKSHVLVGSNADDLKDYAELRNAIVHERSDDHHPIADPYVTTVEGIERLAELLESPPTALAVIGPKTVEMCSPHTTVAEAARLMRDGSFSQLPVADDGRITAVLTSETITRWMASAMDDQGGVILDDHTIAEALPHTENRDHHWQLLGRQSSVFDATRLFDHYSASGWFLDALLITDRGQSDQKLLSIVTMYDLPKLNAAVRT